MKNQTGSPFILFHLVVCFFLLNGCDTLGGKDSGTDGNGSTITDADGNSYNTITIGTQVWMAANLKTTRYSDGKQIPCVKGGNAWANLSTPAYCWPNNDSVTYKNVIGAYYNWQTVNTAKLCPTGWHVPSKDEWTTLETFLGGYASGGKLKAVDHWLTPNAGATNETGFTAYANGVINDAGSFFGPYVERSVLWTSTQYVYNTESYNAWHFQLNWNNTNFDIGNNYNKKAGMGIRCLKD